jgi:hypothetical protein
VVFVGERNERRQRVAEEEQCPFNCVYEAPFALIKSTFRMQTERHRQRQRGERQTFTERGA